MVLDAFFASNIFMTDIGSLMEAIMLLSLVCPFAYSIIIGYAWSIWSKKKYSSSLAPAFMAHIILVLLCGMIFKHLSYGVIAGIGIALFLIAVYVFKNKDELSKENIKMNLANQWENGGYIFTVFYVFCYFINTHKRFVTWDEFSHWGMFLKECLRLDGLYCMSPLVFAHKDYVPAVTLFETIWCKLCFRYTEADAYRAIQIFMFSMLMPVFECFSKYASEKIRISENVDNTNQKLRYRFLELSAVFFVLLIPLVFNTSNAFYFFHSIYCDLAVGIIFFWCIYEAYREYSDFSYQLVSLAIGTSVLVLSKMTAMALFPLIVAFFLAKTIFLSKKKPAFWQWCLVIFAIVIPITLWSCFNKFVDLYVESTGGIQTFDGVKLSLIKDVFTEPENSPISFLGDVQRAFIDAIIHRDILIHGSYIVVTIFVCFTFLVLASYDKKEEKTKIILVSIWTFLSSVYYALLMYFLYSTQFGSYEGPRLASYERYMNSFVISIILLLVAVYFGSELWKKHLNVYYLILLFIVGDLAFLHVSAFDQILPGDIMHDNDMVAAYSTGTEIIMNATNENDNIYIVLRGDNGDYVWHQRYYCCPRMIGGGSIGPAVYDGDIYSSDISVEDFIATVSDYSYIYFCRVDEAFLEKYSDAFENPEQLTDGNIYKVLVEDSKIVLE